MEANGVSLKDSKIRGTVIDYLFYKLFNDTASTKDAT
jgi:hypothetical protein